MTSSNPVNTSFRLAREMHELKFRTVTLVFREWITPEYVRLRLQGDDLSDFTSTGSDDHLRIYLADQKVATIEELRAIPSREYTPLAWGEDWIELEFLVHGDEGIAGRWAANAEIGSVAGIGGPRGSKVLTGRPDCWLLVGDETAVPAIRRFAKLMDTDAVGRIIIEIGGDKIPVDAPVPVEYVHRGGAPAEALAAKLGELDASDRPAGDVFAFVAAEQSIVKPARALLLDRWGLDVERINVRGYWKRGEAEYHAPH